MQDSTKRKFKQTGLPLAFYLLSLVLSKHLSLLMELSINNKNYAVTPADDDSLLTVLRDHLELTGSKYGCGEGACGACTVLVNGTAIKSCTIKPVSVVGKSITTIEGLARDGKLHPVQKAFLDVDVFQCAYCAPGMIMAAVSLLSKNPTPGEQEIISAMQGNICRCGTYPRIIEAIQQAAKV